MEGRACTNCNTREARCAFIRGCCDVCTHNFGRTGRPRGWHAEATHPGREARPREDTHV